ncbi:ribosome-associated protein [Pseudidiomarina planktonica]|uniref:Dual-action ribosomal maturation protein DarP n=1 Tax=Pseudidiomarina planktonica TaxID=1323738 RepID=A0A1Y6ED13_9GAMM|nr:ribosome biogenesis factor YjgA [Pseudidiomarina planktonica]RUO66105.1 DUF615 domain-containing protein [Pseudidiomarina planktonica]SMQ60425.1 ribosome-associated protein [Pseudidiomarina planktonica]
MAANKPEEFDEFDATELPPSKSQLKREMSQLQALGERLVAMQHGQLEQLPIPEPLLDAVYLAQRIRNTREGYRRQLQYIGKLMRGLDTEELEQALHDMDHQSDVQNAFFHQLEKRRDDILAGGDEAIQTLVEEYPSADRQRLRQLYRQAQKQQAENKPPAAARELFKYLREICS